MVGQIGLSQSEWQTSYNAVFFTDSNNGIIVGRMRTIGRTTNGGNTWTLQRYSE